MIIDILISDRPYENSCTKAANTGTITNSINGYNISFLKRLRYFIRSVIIMKNIVVGKTKLTGYNGLLV